MQNRTAQDISACSNAFQDRRNVMHCVLLAGLIGFGAGVANAATNDMPGMKMEGSTGMKDMPGMKMEGSTGMKDMSGMKMPPLPERGRYTTAAESYKVPDVKMVDANGDTVELPKFLNGDAPVMLNFIFTTCTTLCPVMSGTFQEVQGKLGPRRKSIRMVSVSIDPENDTPAELTKYAHKFKAGSQWTFLTGTSQQSVDVQMAFGIFAGEKMNHTPVTFIRAKGAANHWVRIDGLASADQIIKEYDKLQAHK